MKKITTLLLIVFAITVQGQNKLLSSVVQYNVGNGDWQNGNGSNYEYDSNNNLTLETSLNWDNGTNSWNIGDKNFYTYNASNKVTENIYQTSNTTTNQLENSFKQTFTYTNGRVTLIQNYDWVNLNWVIGTKSEIAYNGNNFPQTASTYTWKGTQWDNEYRETLTYNANNRVTTDVTEKWDGTQWVNETKTVFTFTTNNKILNQKSATWDVFNNLWVQDGNKSDYEWDATGNKTIETMYNSYNGSTYQSKNEYTYDTAKLMSSFAHPFKDKTGFDYLFEDAPFVNKALGYTGYLYDTATTTYTSTDRTLYNYTSAITLGIEKVEIADKVITVYPNPTKDFLNIKTASNTTVDKITVSDLMGKKVLEQNKTNQLNVQNLAKGMYVLQILVGDNKETRKFIKE
ncbi:T9SS type A sorting domain-containing protein [Flavobacterium sp.]|uniref:T9SS type A sorting domain-containing protein n=1 Tax=Flavobacterium sp. TaxID=239 RepID=UPI00286DB1C8|nr:T9SS type A sorting domain-containing protein [Flavobacterium sp.]